MHVYFNNSFKDWLEANGSEGDGPTLNGVGSSQDEHNHGSRSTQQGNGPSPEGQQQVEGDGAMQAGQEQIEGDASLPTIQENKYVDEFRTV